MSILRPTNRDGPFAGFLPILIANLLPLIGVLRFGWDPATLAVVYGLEIVLSLLLAAWKALFAQRPPPSDRDGVVSVSDAPLTAKRGSVRAVDWLPPIYPRNVPFALGVLLALVLYGAFLGVVLLSLLQNAERLLRWDVLLGVLGLVVGQLVETKREYFDRREYERVSPYAVVETPSRQLFVLLFLAVPLLEAGSTVVLGAVVGLKLLTEWGAYRAAHDEGDGGRFVGRIAGWFAGPTATGRDDPVRAPSTEPAVRVRPDRTAVLLEGAVHSIWALAFLVPFVGTAWLFIVLAIVAWAGSVLLFWVGIAASVALLLVAVGIQVARHYLEHGTLEYQRREDYLVAYDRLLEEPQWAEAVYRLRNVSVANDRLTDRLLGTRTIRVTTGIRSTEAERRLGPVSEPERLVEAFELPVATTDFEPVDRPLAIGAVGLGAVIVLGAATLAVAPGVSFDTRLNALVFAPFLMLVPVGLWKRACSGS